MEKIRYGIIGLGVQGTHYVKTIFDGGKAIDAYVSAMCDINPDKIEAMKATTENKDVVYFTDYREMLDSGLCDAVLVEVPHYQHPEMVIECLKRGINVICEKPAGVYTKQVKQMNEFAKSSGAIFGMMFNQRTNPLYKKMREMVQGGAIGKLQRVTWIITSWFRTQSYYDSGSWRATWRDEGGGVLINQCPHQIDLVSWIVGENPSAVRSFCHYGKWHDIEVEDDVTAYFEYKDGATGMFITTTGEAPGTNRFEISGTLGKLVCEGDKLLYTKNSVDSQEYVYNSDNISEKFTHETEEVTIEGENPAHSGIINNFTKAILGTEELFVSGLEGINGVELMNAMELSGWRDGERVTLPVNEDEYLEILNEKRKTSRTKCVKDKIMESPTSLA